VGALSTVAEPSFLIVSPMFHRCYAGTCGDNGRALLSPACQTGPGAGPVALPGGYRGPVSNQPAAASGEFYPGQHFGLPESGPGSVAGWSRRLGALLIDWIACSVIALAFLYYPHAGHTTDVFVQPRLWTPVVFGVEDFLLTALTGFTVGKRLLGLRVARLDGRPVGLRALPRTILLMLVVPAMMMDRDLRGLQDKAAGTVVVRI
jgi:uncharacterized RDD family membrane protein YckC